MEGEMTQTEINSFTKYINGYLHIINDHNRINQIIPINNIHFLGDNVLIWFTHIIYKSESSQIWQHHRIFPGLMYINFNDLANSQFSMDHSETLFDLGWIKYIFTSKKNYLVEVSCNVKE